MAEARRLDEAVDHGRYATGPRWTAVTCPRLGRRHNLAMLRAALLTLALLAAAPSGAAGTACPGDFVGGVPPALVNPKLARDSYPLCLSGYATLFSGLTRTPVYSAEHLTAARIEAARAMVRVDSFHPEPQLPPGVRSELSDYRRSGYDRGHMAPNGDMGDEASQRDSFSLANMIPQDHNDNAGLWAAVEQATRDTAVADGEVYVVTGPLYQGGDLTVLQDRVYVPTGIWKAVYDPISNEAGAYLADNRPGWAYKRLSIAELTALTGVDPFPALPDSVKAAAPDLPPPHHGRH